MKMPERTSVDGHHLSVTAWRGRPGVEVGHHTAAFDWCNVERFLV
jgi:hypothetical protein